MIKKPKKKTAKFWKHKLELEHVRHCILFGKKFKTGGEAYFIAQKMKIGASKFRDLKEEIQSEGAKREWFAKEALLVIEEDHQLSVERIRMMEDRLLQEFEQVASTSFYAYSNESENQQELIKNESHDAQLLLRIIAQFQSLQETKDKMYSATAMVQEMSEIQKRREEEEDLGNVTNTPIKNSI